MRKDIELPKITDVGIAIVKEQQPTGETEWVVYLVNLKEQTLKNVFINSSGEGESAGEVIKTSTLRHFFEEVNGLTLSKVELIMPEMFALNNSFWLSFYLDDKLYDKKFVFEEYSIKDQALEPIPFSEHWGVIKW